PRAAPPGPLPEGAPAWHALQPRGAGRPGHSRASRRAPDLEAAGWQVGISVPERSAALFRLGERRPRPDDRSALAVGSAPEPGWAPPIRADDRRRAAVTASAVAGSSTRPGGCRASARRRTPARCAAGPRI